MENGDILLKDGKIYSENGDLAHGNAKEQLIGANLAASTGNFRLFPTVGANVYKDINAPENVQRFVNKITNSLELDGWELDNIAIDIDKDNNLILNVLNAEKVTDDTKGLI